MYLPVYVPDTSLLYQLIVTCLTSSPDVLSGDMCRSVQVANLAEMSFRDQLLTASQTSVFIGPHGAAFALIPFLPKSAIVVELQPYSYGYAPYTTLLVYLLCADQGSYEIQPG